MKTFLAAFDFSATSPKVAGFAANMATAAHGKLVILHVLEMPPLRERGSDLVVHSNTMDPPDLNQIKERLDRLAEPLRTNGLIVETIVAIGKASEEILKLAKSTDAMMIILGSRGHGVISQAFVGSVVTSVLSKAEIPVTVVPAHEE